MDNTILIEGFGAMDGHVEDINSYRAEICANIATFSVFALIQKVYGLSAPTIEHICDNQSVIIATWKDKKINVFDKTKANADVSKDARTAIADLQCHSKVNQSHGTPSELPLTNSPQHEKSSTQKQVTVYGALTLQANETEGKSKNAAFAEMMTKTGDMSSHANNNKLID
jgi:hypothetical protein